MSDAPWPDEPVDAFLVGDVVRLVDAASNGWARLRRWVLDRGTAAASAGEVRQQAGTRGYRLRRIASSTRRLGSQPADYDVRDTSGVLRLHVAIGAATRSATAPATLTAGELVAHVPSVRSHPLGTGLTVTDGRGAPLLVVPDEPGVAWSALDPAGHEVARVEYVAPRAGWIDPRNRRARSALSAGPDPVDLRSGDVLTFTRTSGPLERLLVLGVAISRAHRRS